MRFLHIDREDIHARGKVTLDRPESMEPVTLTIHALPPTYAQDAEKEVPSPERRRLGLSRNKKGIIDKDAQNRPIMLYDDENPEYVAALREVNELQSIKMIYDALDPQEVEFETKRDSMPPRKFYERVRAELHEIGFSVGDLVRLVKAIVELSNLTDEDIEAAGLDFFGTESSRRRMKSAGSSGQWADSGTSGQSSQSESVPSGSPTTGSNEIASATS